MLKTFLMDSKRLKLNRKDMNETEWGQLIPQRLRLTEQVDAAHCWAYDLANSLEKHRWPLCCLITFPWLHVLSENAVFSRGDVRLQVDSTQGEKREECKATVYLAGRGHAVSSSLTSAREMLQLYRRYARHWVTSWSAASCKTWTLTIWHSSIGISYIKRPFSLKWWDGRRW